MVQEHNPKKDRPEKMLNLDLLRAGLAENFPNSKFLLTLHTIDGGKIIHSYLTQDFPNGDLLPCVKYLEDEFVGIAKRGATGNGRM